MVSGISRNLRKIYAITKQNMDLLDKAVVQSFIETFPDEGTQIHMGKLGPQIKIGKFTDNYSVRKLTTNRKPGPKKKEVAKAAT